MSEPTGGAHGEVERPTEEQLAELSRDELTTLGMKLDGVEMIEYNDPWPVKGTRAERRAERVVAFWFILAALAAVAFIVIFIAWPWQYQKPGDQGVYSLYTPLLGVTLGLTVLGVGIGALTYVKKFIPHELAVQDRHDGQSAEVDRQTILAELYDAGNRSTIARRGGRHHGPGSRGVPAGRSDQEPVEQVAAAGGHARAHRLVPGAGQPGAGLPAQGHRRPERDLPGPPVRHGRGRPADGVPVPRVGPQQPGRAA
jgi:hypothetical protein